VGQVALANPGRDYVERDLALVERLAALYALAVQRARTEDELAQYRAHLEELVEERTAELKAANEQLEHEIADRRRAEEALKEEQASLARRVAERTAELSIANAELRRAARLKDEFLVNMSHELRTPLNAILGMSEALQEEVYGSLNERQRNSLGTIERSGRYLLALIDDILDLSRIEAGKLQLHIGPVSVESVCRASLQLVRPEAEKKQLTLSSTLDGGVTTVLADELRLRQILINLLGNAVKFTPEGGAVGLEVAGDAEQEIVHLAVWDTGPGIREEDVPRLFKAFEQLDGGLSRQHGGTGLGLTLVRRLVEMHGGSVSVESDGLPGKGSRFTVSLPWRRAVESKDSEEGDKESPSVPLSRSMTVLLVEDNESNILTVSGYLESQGYQVIVAREGAEAVERVREERPDLVLMDIHMPGMNGLEATRRLRAEADPAVAAVPIIALTALAMPGDRERCLAAGADEYLNKPFGLKHLVQVIETQLVRP